MLGVPQGLVLGPIEFCSYTIPRGAIMQHYKIEYLTHEVVLSSIALLTYILRMKLFAQSRTAYLICGLG